MTVKEIFKNSLGDALFQQVTDALGEDFDWDYVPKKRLDKVIGERNTLRDQLADRAEDDADGVSKKDLQAQITTLKAQHQVDLDNVNKRYVLLDTLRSEKARNPEMVLKQFDLTKVLKNKEGKWEGYQEQLEALKKSDAYLFESDSGQVPGGTGKEGGTGDDGKGGSKAAQVVDSLFGAFM